MFCVTVDLRLGQHITYRRLRGVQVAAGRDRRVRETGCVSLLHPDAGGLLIILPRKPNRGSGGGPLLFFR